MGERGGGGEERWEKGMTPPSDRNNYNIIHI